MAKGPSDFAQQNAERAMQATNDGMNWMREIAEHNLTQSKAALEGMLKMTRKAADGIDEQTSALREHALLLARETFGNAFDFAHKALHIKDPSELARLQSEFVSRQAQVLGDQTKEFGQSLMRGANDMASTALTTAQTARARSEAA
jgi:hypothetical protein